MPESEAVPFFPFSTVPLRRRALLRGASVFGLTLVGLAACSQPSPTTVPSTGGTAPTAASGAKPQVGATSAPAVQGGDFKIAMHVPLTGASALFGQQLRDGALMAIAEVNGRIGANGRTINTIVEDSGADNTSAINAYNKIVSDKPVAVIGSLVSTQVFAISQAIKEAKIPYVFSSTNTGVTRQGIPFLFRVTVHDESRNRAGIRYLVDDLKKQKVASMHTNDEYGVGAAKIVADELSTRYKLQPAADESFSATDKDMSGQLVRIKNAGADSMMLNAFPQQAALVLKQFSQLGLKAQITVMGDNGIVSPALLNLLTEDESDGLYGASAGIPQASTKPEVQDWIKRYQEKYNRPPDNYSANAYDGARMVIRVLQDGATNAEQVRDGLAKLNGFQGLLYPFTFDKYGDGVHEIVITKSDKRSPKILNTVKLDIER